jgi:hypothetical protein
VNARRETQTQIDAFNRQAAERERRAQFEIARATIETQANYAQEVIANSNMGYADRLIAAEDFYQAQQALINGQKDLELSSATLTATERKAVEENANTALVAARQQYHQTLNQIAVENVEKESTLRMAAVNKERDESIIALNERFNKGLLSTQEYHDQRLRLERGYSVESLQVAIDNVKATIDLYKTLGYEVGQAEAELADLQKQLSDEVTNKKIQDLERLQAKTKELGTALYDLTETIVTASFERQSEAVREQIDALEERKQKEIETANQSITNEAKKAEAIAVIEARAQSQRETLERRQRQIELERARAERLFTIGRVIADTAAAVVAALGSKPFTPANIALAAVVGAIGAAQIAKVLATPIPRYADGTDYHPGGPALVGDRYISELMVTPEGRISKTPSRPTVMNLAEGTIVHPDAREALQSGIMANWRSGSVMNRNEMKELQNTLKTEFRGLKAAIKSKPEKRTKVTGRALTKMIKYGETIVRYIDESINFPS